MCLWWAYAADHIIVKLGVVGDVVRHSRVLHFTAELTDNEVSALSYFGKQKLFDFLCLALF